MVWLGNRISQSSISTSSISLPATFHLCRIVIRMRWRSCSMHPRNTKIRWAVGNRAHAVLVTWRNSTQKNNAVHNVDIHYNTTMFSGPRICLFAIWYSNNLPLLLIVFYNTQIPQCYWCALRVLWFALASRRSLPCALAGTDTCHNRGKPDLCLETPEYGVT